MRIGLSGATGTLGRRIAAQLTARSHMVVPFRGDVRQREAIASWVNGLDYVIHSAAVVPVDRVRDHLADAIGVNVIGAANVAEMVARQSSCGLCYISSSHVYAPDARPLTENAPTLPQSRYGLTKLHGENWVFSIIPQALAIRVFSFYDALQAPSFLVPALTERIKAAQPGSILPLRGAQCSRDIADATWVAAICVRLVEQRASGIVNCGTGYGFFVREIAEHLAAALGRSDLIWQGFPDDAVNSLVADTLRLTKLLGAVPTFNLAQSLSNYVSALR